MGPERVPRAPGKRRGTAPSRGLRDPWRHSHPSPTGSSAGVSLKTSLWLWVRGGVVLKDFWGSPGDRRTGAGSSVAEPVLP